MEKIRGFALTFVFVLAATVMLSHEAAAQRMLRGELVVLKGTTNQFRLVGHNGSFSAPPGTDLSAFDGKTVEVDLASNGRVQTINTVPIAIQPVEHGQETVSGQLELRDAVNRTFNLAGDSRVYVAPSRYDLRPYDGRWVQLRLDENGQLVDIVASNAPAPAAPRAPVAGDAPRSCLYHDATMSAGSSICKDGTTYRCTDGMWVNLGTPCS